LWRRDGLDDNASFSPPPAAIDSASNLLSVKTELIHSLGFVRVGKAIVQGAMVEVLH
jgi:hypothetical protein